jgi:translation elongation factor EF-1alpha
MYNPDYCNRAHVVALNKMDMEDAGALRDEIAHEVMAAAAGLVKQYPGESSSPVAIVACSALTGKQQYQTESIWLQLYWKPTSPPCMDCTC